MTKNIFIPPKVSFEIKIKSSFCKLFVFKQVHKRRPVSMSSLPTRLFVVLAPTVTFDCFVYNMRLVKVIMCNKLFSCVIHVYLIWTCSWLQHSLTYDGLKDYIIKGSDGKGGRIDLLDANREGLYSCLGFFSLYIMGVQLGKVVMRQRWLSLTC